MPAGDGRDEADLDAGQERARDVRRRSGRRSSGASSSPVAVLEAADDQVRRRAGTRNSEREQEEREEPEPGPARSGDARARRWRAPGVESSCASATDRIAGPVGVGPARLLDVDADDGRPSRSVISVGRGVELVEGREDGAGRRPAAWPAGPPGRRSRRDEVLVADRVAVALQPDELALVGVQELHPQLGGVRMRRVGADRLDVDAAEAAGLSGRRPRSPGCRGGRASRSARAL